MSIYNVSFLLKFVVSSVIITDSKRAACTGGLGETSPVWREEGGRNV